MRYLAQVLILFVALICVAETSLAQVVVVQPPTPPATTIDIAIQDGSPIKISVTENKTNIPMLLFNIDNVDSRAVRGYVIVTESDKRKHLSTTLYPSDSLRTGAQDKRGFSLFDGTRLSLMVDFVLFEDGTSWEPISLAALAL